MQLIKTFTRKVKTSRKFIFENIMDLEHVCYVHKNWFRDLRIVTQSPYYVEYYLTSVFYGLTQRTHVRGGPIDEDRYWYEFHTPLAKMKVQGSIEGKDGDLVQKELITYNYHWLLHPIFLILSPLFEKQKENILEDDSRLLERMFTLERKGIPRRVVNRPVVVVYGGTGFFGRLVVQDLLEHTEAEIRIASRRPAIIDFDTGDPTRIKYYVSDVDQDDTARVIKGAQVVISCLGPFQDQTTGLLESCIREKIDYVDVADDREFLERCYSLESEIKQSEIRAFIGCSVIPGISSLLTEFSLEITGTPETVKICITPGTRYARGPGSFACLLSTLGRKIHYLRDGKFQKIEGWTGGDKVNFPPPIGKRNVYFIVDTPDYLLQPRYFGTRNVEFRIGAEFEYLNKSLAFFGKIQTILGLRNLNFCIPLFRKIIGFAGLFGTTQGGVMVHVIGNPNGRNTEWITSVHTETHGEVIPALLPSIATQMILRDEIPQKGIVPLNGWITHDRFVKEFRKRNIEISGKGSLSDQWKPVTGETNPTQEISHHP